MSLIWLAIACSQAPLQGERPQLYVADLQAQTVWSFQEGEALEPLVTVESIPPEHRRDGFKPSALALAGEDLLVANSDGGEIYRVDRATGEFLELLHDNGWGTLRLEEPCALELLDGELLALGNDTRNLLRISPDPAELDAVLRSAHSMAISQDEGLTWVGSAPSIRGQGLLQAWDLEQGVLAGELAPYPVLQSVTGLAVDRGLLWVADWFAQELVVLDPATGERVGTPMGPEQLREPVDVMAFGEDIYLLETQALWRLSPGRLPQPVPVPGLEYGRNMVAAWD